MIIPGQLKGQDAKYHYISFNLVIKHILFINVSLSQTCPLLPSDRMAKNPGKWEDEVPLLSGHQHFS